MFVHSAFTVAILLLACAMLPAAAGAATLFPAGTYYSNEHFTKAGSPYIIDGFVYFRGGTLVVDSGVVVKFKTATSTLGIHGDATFTSLATKDEPVYFTSYKDDVHGGDTNGDSNATSPAPGDWSNLNVGGGSSFGSDKLDFTRVYYGGAPSTGAPLTPVYALQVYYHKYDGRPAANFTLANIEVAHNQNGLYIFNNGHNVTVTASGVHDNANIGAIVNLGGAYYSGNDLRGNWWGSPSGPRSSTNPSGTGDYVVGSWPVTPWLVEDPLPPPSPLGPLPCTVECFSNVLFLPGIESSRLYAPGLLGENQIWEPNSAVGGDVTDLDMTNQNASDSVYVKEGEVVDAAYEGIPGFDGYKIYSSFINQMDALKISGQINEWLSIAYDWRLDYDDLLNYGRQTVDGKIYYRGSNAATTSDPYIVQELKRLASSSRSAKVTIIAHSNGGLLAREIMTRPDLAQYVDRVILVASPQLGTPQAIGGLLHGFGQALPDEKLPLFLSAANARYLGQAMPMAYNLLPSDSYFQFTQNPVIRFDPVTMRDWVQKYGQLITTQNQLRIFMTDVARTKPGRQDLSTPEVTDHSLHQNAIGVHAELDSWVPASDVEMITVAGWGNPTVSGIEYKRVPTFACLIRAPDGSCALSGRTEEITYAPTMVVDGDGTVVDSSAQWTNGASSTRYWLNLSSLNSDTGSEYTHANIFESPQVRSLLAALITQATSTPLPQYVVSSRPEYSASGSRLYFTLHSPLTLGFSDGTGNYTGATSSSALFEVPGVVYRRFGEVQWLSVPKSTAGKVVLQGTGSGSFALDVEEVNGNDILANTTFAAIPSSTSTIATFEIDPLRSPTSEGVLNVDFDGDGAVDTTLYSVEGETVLPKSPLTVTADDQAMIVGGTMPSLTASLTGFANGDTETSNGVTGTAECTTTATNSSPVGNYPITCTVGTLSSSDYEFKTFIDGTLTIQYRWDGFLQPIDDPTTNSTLTPSVFKGGSTVPVKFQLKSSNGAAIQSSTAPLWITPVPLALLAASVDEPVYTISGTTGSIYRWDATNQQYVYNWSTKGLATGLVYKISVNLDDGTTKEVAVGLR
ncbi:MAG: PxKF domain-containing protein [Patescibacteria group bacterium]